MTGGRIAILLEEMAGDIRAARLSRLEEIAPELEAALPDLAAMDREGLVAIGRQADDALRLLSAMMQGVRSARRRLADIAAAERALTYAADGTKTGLSEPRPGQRV
jgi:hypothetical protein